MVAVMTDGPEASPDLKLVFTKEEWNAAVPGVTREMTKYLAGYRTPVFKDCGEYGDGWGSGSFVEVRGSKFILTNEHVAAPRRSGKNLGFQLANQETLVSVRGNHVEQAWPWDLALLPVSDAGWSDLKHSSDAIEAEQIALAHTPVPTEIFAFSGFAGEGASFNFNTLFFKATTSIAREVELPADARWDSRFHFGLDYRPDLAKAVIGNDGLPAPPGLSGSTVWNTCFVEAKMKSLQWTPELARVTGVVWGWPSGHGFLVATRAEHVRSFLLGARSALGK